MSPASSLAQTQTSVGAGRLGQEFLRRVHPIGSSYQALGLGLSARSAGVPADQASECSSTMISISPPTRLRIFSNGSIACFIWAAVMEALFSGAARIERPDLHRGDTAS